MKQNVKYSRRLIAAAALIVALGVGAWSVQVTLAAENSQGEVVTLVEAIAERFDVKVADVQAVFDEHRSEMEAKHAEHREEMLNKAVEDGKITQEQADLIVEKRAEMKEFMESLKDKTDADRKSAMKTEMDEVKAWAEENAIPLHFVLPPQPKHHQGGRHGMMGQFDPEDESES